MTVFVDDWRQPAQVGRLSTRWSHLTVGPHDDLAELHDFAAHIGLRRSWFQDKPWPRAHYDVTEAKRQQAITAGATPITWRQAGQQALTAIEQRRERTARPATRIVAMGSRRWSDPAAICAALAAVTARRLGEDLILVHGRCDPRHASGRPIRWTVAEKLSPQDQLRLHGADWLSDRTARQMGWQVEQVPADWDAHRRADPNAGNPAGMIRNVEMIDRGAAEGVAFIQDRSPGASHAAAYAERQGIHVDRHEVTTAAPRQATPPNAAGTGPDPAPAVSARQDGLSWVEPAYGFRSGVRTCADPHRGQGDWQASARSQDADGARCRDGHPLAGPLCEVTARRLAAAGITPDDPRLAFIRTWNASAQARMAPEQESGDREAEQEAGT